MPSANKNRGLGKGLGALLGDAQLQNQEGGSVLLPISQVEPGLNQPRKRFDQEALEAIADTSLKRKTGARGLRAIMENIMMDTMYEVPSDETIKECRITKEAVNGTGKPLYLRDGEERRSFLTTESA